MTAFLPLPVYCCSRDLRKVFQFFRRFYFYITRRLCLSRWVYSLENSLFPWKTFNVDFIRMKQILHSLQSWTMETATAITKKLRWVLFMLKHISDTEVTVWIYGSSCCSMQGPNFDAMKEMQLEGKYMPSFIQVRVLLSEDELRLFL